MQYQVCALHLQFLILIPNSSDKASDFHGNRPSVLSVHTSELFQTDFFQSRAADFFSLSKYPNTLSSANMHKCCNNSFNLTDHIQ